MPGAIVSQNGLDRRLPLAGVHRHRSTAVLSLLAI
jgi:hypothetical protein